MLNLGKVTVTYVGVIMQGGEKLERYVQYSSRLVETVSGAGPVQSLTVFKDAATSLQ